MSGIFIKSFAIKDQSLIVPSTKMVIKSTSAKNAWTNITWVKKTPAKINQTLMDVILIYKNKVIAKNVRKINSSFSLLKSASKQSTFNTVKNSSQRKVVEFVMMVIIQSILVKDVFKYLQTNNVWNGVQLLTELLMMKITA